MHPSSTSRTWQEEDRLCRLPACNGTCECTSSRSFYFPPPHLFFTASLAKRLTASQPRMHSAVGGRAGLVSPFHSRGRGKGGKSLGRHRPKQKMDLDPLKSLLATLLNQGIVSFVKVSYPYRQLNISSLLLARIWHRGSHGKCCAVVMVVVGSLQPMVCKLGYDFPPTPQRSPAP